MGALTIAFDITIVRALALPWIVLLIHLFCFEGENRIGSFLGWLKEQEQPAAVGALLFGMAYTLGSAVSRVAQILTVAAGLGWRSTEVLYGEQVVYSYDSQEMAAAQKQISFGSGSR
jgi:hypothetical protein